MTPEEEVQRGLEAERILKEPLLIEAFERLEQEYVKAWQTSPARDADAREKLYQMQNCLHRVKDHLRVLMESGRIIQKRTLMDRVTGRKQPHF